MFAGPTAGLRHAKISIHAPLYRKQGRSYRSLRRETRLRPFSNGSPTRRVLPNRFLVNSVGSVPIIPPFSRNPAPFSARPVSGKPRRPGNGLHTELPSLRTTRARERPERSEREPDGSNKYVLSRTLSLRTPVPKRPAHATGRRTDCLRSISGRVNMPKAPSIPNKRGASQVLREPGKPEPAADANSANAAPKTAPARS